MSAGRDPKKLTAMFEAARRRKLSKDLARRFAELRRRVRELGR